jgi:hypothetical protein
MAETKKSGKFRKAHFMYFNPSAEKRPQFERNQPIYYLLPITIEEYFFAIIQ